MLRLLLHLLRSLEEWVRLGYLSATKSSNLESIVHGVMDSGYGGPILADALEEFWYGEYPPETIEMLVTLRQCD